MAYQEPAQEISTEFDLRTHIRDPKTGLVVKKNPYRMYARDGAQFFERPVGSGNLWYKSGEPAGRMVDGEIKCDEPHAAWVPPQTEDDKLAMSLIAKDERISQLERELEAIRKEKKAAAAPAKPK